MAGSDLPNAELVAQFSNDDPPRLIRYHVVIQSQPIALLPLGELSLARFSPVHDVQAFQIADDVQAGSILFWHPDDRKLHPERGVAGLALGIAIKSLAAGAVVRPSFDGFVMLEGDFNLTDDELAAIAAHQAAE